MNARQSSLLGLAMCAVALGLSAFWWGHLPDPMPIHFGPDGRPDGWGSRTLGTLLMPGLMLALHAMFGALPALSPRGFEPHRDQALGAFRVATLGFLLFMHNEILWAAAHEGHLALGAVGLAMGLLFVVLGNWMTKVRRNFFIGIRTPWTLADPEVWDQTHRIAGRLFLGAGAFVAICSVLQSQPHVSLWVVPLLVAALVPAAYSFVLYKRRNG